MASPLTGIILALVLAHPATAKEPLSAIPWLSDSLTTQERPKPRAPKASAREELAEIEMKPLEPLKREGVGILAPETTGLPENLWKGMSELRVRRLIKDAPLSGVPAARELLARILLARTIAPAGSGEGDTLLVARVDRLLEMGRLDAADALIAAGGNPSGALFRRQFDIGLLTGRLDLVCDQLLAAPEISPSRQAMVFCLISNGQWKPAEALLEDAMALGEITDSMGQLLARFLDPDAFEDMPPPKMETPLSAMEFVIRDAIALPRPTTRLPLAFRHADLDGHSGLRQRILAAEALVAVGAIPANVLFAAYREGAPAASGGAWDRAAAVQDLDDGFDLGGWKAPLSIAMERLGAINLLPALASEYTEFLAPLMTEPDAPDGIGLLGALSGQLVESPPKTWSEIVAAVHDLSRPVPPEIANPLLLAAHAGLNGALPDSEPAARARDMLDRQEVGAALLHVHKLLGAGSEIDPDDLQTALYVLGNVGLQKLALRTAIETLLLGKNP